MRPPGGACSRYAALRHEVARAAAILPRNQLHVRGGRAAAGSLRRQASTKRKERWRSAPARLDPKVRPAHVNVMGRYRTLQDRTGRGQQEVPPAGRR